MTDSGTDSPQAPDSPAALRESRDIRRGEAFGKRRVPTRLWAMASVVLATILAAGASPALALPSSPSLKPRPAFSSPHLASAEFTQLRRALEAGDAGIWSEVRAASQRLSDPGARALLRWKLATEGAATLPFSELNRMMEEFKGWPDESRIQEQAEVTIQMSALIPADRVTWLKARGPRTGEGVLALASAYRQLGRIDEMRATIRDAWRGMAMSDAAERQILLVHGSDLTAEDHWARTDMLMWRGETSSAQALLPRLTTSRRQLAEARLALRMSKRNVDALIDKLSADQLDDPGLCYERARWRERKGLQAGELEMLVRIRGESASPAGRRAIWNEKHQVLRRLVREGDVATAYTLAAGHGLTSGEEFRDAEWTAGWLALKLKDPVKAEGHFRTFGAGVTSPISVARAQYWLGEALTAQKRTTEAQTAYETAAAFPYVFYGQLAAERIATVRPDLRMLAFLAVPAPTDAERAAFAARPMVRAAILLADAGRLSEFERLSNRIDDQLDTPVEHQMLFDIGREYLHMRAAVRSGKAGLGKGVIAPDAVFPLLPLPASSRNGAAEDAMVLALSRQESEFHSVAVSSADARGMMQMVPRYAQAEARMVGMPYRASWLTDDPNYNLKLGRGFLDDVVNEFGGSYILAAAAYNAGPSRARQWIAEFGDPRGEVDPVEWIETIPFAETRNYVQRVLENTQVYRHRLTGKPVMIQLRRDISRGRR